MTHVPPPAEAAQHRILLIEDMPGDARLVELALREAGAAHVIETRETLAGLGEALDEARNAGEPAFDVVLLDLSLPDSFGLDTVAGALALLADRKLTTIPVVVLTGLDDPRMGLAAIQAGAQDYIIKGEFNPHLFQRVIHYAIERKATERRHALLLERHAEILNSLGEGVVEVDRHSIVRHLNPAAAELTGCAVASVIGRPFADLLGGSAGGTASQAVRILDQTLAEGGRRELFGIALRGPCDCAVTGAAVEPVEVDLVVTPLRQDGAIAGAVIALRDLRGRNDAYRTLADHLAYESQIMDMLREAVVTVDPQGIIIGFNAAFRTLTGGEDSTLLGADLIDVLPGPLAESAFLDMTALVGTDGPTADIPDGRAAFAGTGSGLGDDLVASRDRKSVV